MPNTNSNQRRKVPTPSATRRSLSTRPSPGAYRRERDLPGLIPLIADDLLVLSPERHRALLALIRKALRAERRRGRAGDWSYDLGRHAALIAAYRHELDLFETSHPQVPPRTRAASL